MAWTMDVKTEKVGELRSDIMVPLESLDSHFRKTPIFTRKKRAILPGDAFEDTEFNHYIYLFHDLFDLFF
jgi:hypothetical protein